MVSSTLSLDDLPSQGLDAAIFTLDTVISGILEACDPEGDAMTFGLVSAPTKGELTLNAVSSKLELGERLVICRPFDYRFSPV